jgi:uncharacterized protein (TIGR02001 family)
MRNLRMLAALGLVTVAGVASAQEDEGGGFSSTVYAVSDYDFRGSSQNAKDPTLQASIDYTGDNGLVVGAWASQVDFGPADVDLEVDVYGIFNGKFSEKFGWTTGVTYYAYPDESDFNYIEVFGGVSYDMVSAKIWYSNEFLGDAGEATALDLTGDDDTSAFYLEGNAAIPLPNNFSILVHLGLSTGDFFENAIGDDIVDYSLGVGYATGKFNMALKFVGNDTGDVPDIKSDVFNQEERVLFTVQTTFPW